MLTDPASLPDYNTPWLFNGVPALVAHRGFAHLFPENTLTSLAAAVDAGAFFVEFDIQLSKDRQPFLMHDASFQRTAGIDKTVFDLTMSQINQISVTEPQRLGGRFQGVKPITLRHLCEHLNGWKNIHSFVEVKRQSVEAFGLDMTMNQIADALQTLAAPFSVISFREDVVERAQAMGIASTAWVIRDWNAQSFATLERLAPEFVFCDYKDIPDDDALPEGPWSWVLYEVTSPDVACELRQRGAHMIESMVVSAMLGAPPFCVPSGPSS